MVSRTGPSAKLSAANMQARSDATPETAPRSGMYTLMILTRIKTFTNRYSPSQPLCLPSLRLVGVRDSRAPPTFKTRTCAPESLARDLASRHPLHLQSQAGFTSCRPKSPATRVRTLLLSSALKLRETISRTRLHDLLRCIQHSHHGLVTHEGAPSPLWQLLRRDSEGQRRLRGPHLRNSMLWTTWRASDRDRASRSGPAIGKSQLFLRRPQSVSRHLVV